MYYQIHFVGINRKKRYNPNKPPPSHRISDEAAEVTSLFRQCRSRNINYDENNDVLFMNVRLVVLGFICFVHFVLCYLFLFLFF